MIEILKKYNYNYVDENTWVKNNWTVRIIDETVEVFSDPDKTKGRYFIGPKNSIDLQEILEEIDYYNL
jgi:hypothetical protein